MRGRSGSAAAGAVGTTRGAHRPLGNRTNGRSRSAVAAALARPARDERSNFRSYGCSSISHTPQSAWRRRLSSLSFLAPTGLAVGLALKELRYAIPMAIRPSRPRRVAGKAVDPWFPRVPLRKPELRLRLTGGILTPRADGSGTKTGKLEGRCRPAGTPARAPPVPNNYLSSAGLTSRDRRGIKGHGLRILPWSRPDGMRPSPVPPILIALSTRCWVTLRRCRRGSGPSRPSPQRPSACGSSSRSRGRATCPRGLAVSGVSPARAPA